jgi:hypothetical protein
MCKVAFGSLTIALALGAASGAALADNHMTVDTVSGNPGDQIIIKAGFYLNEQQFSIVGGRLMENGAIAVYTIAPRLVSSGAYTGWYSDNPLTLTSDYFYTTGRLNGGNFKFELASITVLSGGPTVLAWGDYADENQSEPFTPSALSNASTRPGRSFDVGIKQHDDSQGLAFSAPGLYDVTFIAWDSNGRYADSAPVTARFDVVPAPGAASLLGLGGLLALRRRRV